MKTLLVGLVLISAALGADTYPDRFYTAGTLNGHWWTSSGVAEGLRIGYLMGYADHVASFGLAKPPGFEHLPGTEMDWFPPTLTFGEISKAIDRVYDQPENLNLSLRYALRIIAMRVAGKSEKYIDDTTRVFREGSKLYAGKP